MLAALQLNFPTQAKSTTAAKAYPLAFFCSRVRCRPHFDMTQSGAAAGVALAGACAALLCAPPAALAADRAHPASKFLI